MTYGRERYDDELDEEDDDDDESEDDEEDDDDESESDDESGNRPARQIIGRKTGGIGRVSHEAGVSKRKMDGLMRSFGTRGVWSTRPNPRKVGH